MLIEHLMTLPEAYVIIFNHIPKVGGTSIYYLFLDVLGENKCFRHRERIPDTNEFTPPITDLTEAERQTLRFAMGHFAYGNHRLFVQQPYYIGIIRDPVERLVSDYYYNRERGQEKLKQKALAFTLEEYALDKLSNPSSQMVSNAQIRLLTGADNLEDAKSILENEYLLACTTPQLDAFQTLMLRFMGIQNPRALRRNVTKSKPARVELSSSTVEALKARNDVDLLLYQYIEQRFDEINLSLSP